MADNFIELPASGGGYTPGETDTILLKVTDSTLTGTVKAGSITSAELSSAVNASVASKLDKFSGAGDNVIVRTDTNGNTVQTSGATIDDSGNILANAFQSGSVLNLGVSGSGVILQVSASTRVTIRPASATDSDILFAGTAGSTIQAGTTAERPSSPVTGTIRYNSTLGQYEGYLASTWSSFGDVFGPASSTDRAIVTFNGATGKIIRNSSTTISALGALVNDGSVSVRDKATPLGTNLLEVTNSTGASIYGVVDANGVGGSGITASTAIVSDANSRIKSVAQLPLNVGGTNAALTASAGSVAYSSASALALTAVGTLDYPLVSNGTSAPSWTEPATRKFAAVDATTTITATSRSGILILTNTGARAVTLPTTPAAYTCITVKDGAGTAFTANITITSGGADTFAESGTSTYVIDSDRAAVEFTYLSGQWHAL